MAPGESFDRSDVIFSLIFTIITGISLYLTLTMSWTLFPLVLINAGVAGFICKGGRHV